MASPETGLRRPRCAHAPRRPARAQRAARRRVAGAAGFAQPTARRAAPPDCAPVRVASASHAVRGSHGHAESAHVDSIAAAARGAPCPPALTGVLVARPCSSPLPPPRHDGAPAHRNARSGRRHRDARRRSRSPTLLADVTVIDAEEIARAGVHGLAELLQRQPGVEIMQNGGPGGVSGVFLRGANRGQTLVLVDGLRVGVGVSAARRRWRRSRSTQIERIEILRGPASSLYGADAIGGVIQVFTSGASATPQATVSAAYGTYDTRDAQRGSSRGSAGPLRLSLQAAAHRERRLQRDRPIPRTSTTTRTRRLPQRQRDRRSRAAAGADGHELARQVSPQPARRAVRRQRRIRRPHGHHRRDLAGREPQPAGAVLDVAADCRRRAATTACRKTEFGDFPFGTRQTQLRLAERLHAAAAARSPQARAPRGAVATDAAFAVTSRDTEFGVRRSISGATPCRRCRPTCAGTTRRSTAARRPARSPTATGVLAGAGA